MFEEHMETKTRVRDIIYGGMYGKPYRYGVRPKGSADDGARSDVFPEDGPIDPVTLPVKGYIPPTDVEALPHVLDAPMGG